jgi:hypothetical protein
MILDIALGGFKYGYRRGGILDIGFASGDVGAFLNPFKTLLLNEARFLQIHRNVTNAQIHLMHKRGWAALIPAESAPTRYFMFMRTVSKKSFPVTTAAEA